MDKEEAAGAGTELVVAVRSGEQEGRSCRGGRGMEGK